MKAYLAGYICGAKLKECIEWRVKIRDHYNNYKGERYPIEWLDPLNSGELDHIDDKGLKSNIPRNAIVQKDLLSIEHADIVIANLDTFGEVRPPIGTICEIALAWYLRKPIILITNQEHYIEHSFLSYFASMIVKDVDELLSTKYVNLFYKAINSAIY
jgi:hypothetical protein